MAALCTLKKKKKNRSSYNKNSDLRHACRVFKSQQRCIQHALRTIRIYVANLRVISIARPFLETRAKVFFDLCFICKVMFFFLFRLRGTSVDHWSTPPASKRYYLNQYYCRQDKRLVANKHILHF